MERNQKIRGRQRTLEYQEEFEKRFPQTDANERKAAYAAQYDDKGRLKPGALGKTDNAAGKESIKRQFREARRRRGVPEQGKAGFTGDTRVRRKGKKFTDSIGRPTDAPTPLDNDVANLNQKFPYGATSPNLKNNLHRLDERGRINNMVHKRKSRSRIKQRVADIIRLGNGERTTPSARTMLDQAGPNQSPRRGGLTRARQNDRNYPSRVELRKQKRQAEYIRKRIEERRRKSQRR